MALRAPERRTTLEEDLARALALSRADKRLGEYFPDVGDTSGAWHFNGTEHTGGGFDQDQYAYRDRKSARREWEVSVVQYAREREVQDRGWEAEQEWREIGDPHAVEEAEVERAKRRQEDAWSREQHARKEPALKTKPTQRSAAEILASRSTTLHPDDLAAARTNAWANGLRYVGDGFAAEEEEDPTEPAQLRRMPEKHKDFSYTSPSEASFDYGEQIYNPHSPEGSLYTRLSRSASYSSILNIPPPRHHSNGVKRNVSVDSSSHPPTLPSKHSAQRLQTRPPKERLESVVVVSNEEYSDGARPPSYSTMDTRPEDIRVFSPSHPSEGTIAHIKSRPGSMRRASKYTPIEENYVFVDDEKSSHSPTSEDDKKYIPSPPDDRDISVFHVSSTQLNLKKKHMSAMAPIGQLEDDTIELPRGVSLKRQSRLSKSPFAAPLSRSATMVGPVASPTVRHITGTTLNNPEADSPQSTDPSHLQESLPLTINEVWGISRDWVSKDSLEAQSVDADLERASEATPTPAPVTLPSVNTDKSLPGTPYTQTHSTISLYKTQSAESFALLRRPLSGGLTPLSGAPGNGHLINSPSGSSGDRPQHSEASESVTPNSQQSEQSYPVDMVSPTETPLARYPPRSSASIPSSNSSDTVRVSPRNGHQRGHSEGSIRPTQPIAQARNEKKLPPVPMQADRFGPHTGDPFVYTGPRPIIPHADRESAVRRATEVARQRSLSPISDEEEFFGRPGATVRQSAHTFGNPNGRHSQVAFEDVGDGRTWGNTRHDSKATIPTSLAPSMKSARTRTSTLRASMRSPLPGISEKDTSSEYSWGGGEGGHYGSVLHTATWAAESVEDELIRGDVHELEVYPVEGVVDHWAPGGIMTGPSSRHTRSRSEGSSYRQPYQDGITVGTSPRSSSSGARTYQGSFGHHAPISQHPSRSMNNSAPAETHRSSQSTSEVAWPEFNEEENMAGVGAHFRRALSSNKSSS